MAYTLLNGKKGIISGALNEQSIAWKVALKAREEGATFTLTNAPVAGRLGEINKLAELCQAEIIYADATVVEDIEKLYRQSMDILGGQVDFVLHSIGMSPNIRKDKDHGSLNYDWFIKTLDISALSFHKMLQVADNLDAMAEYGSFVALSYIAAQRNFPFYSDMAQAKALLESIARGYGYRFAKKNRVRINTISQSPTRTTAGQGIGGFDAFFEYADKMSPLGNAPAEACADYVVTLFSDLTRYVTMQNLYHDGGFSAMGLSPEIIDMISPKEA